jgi:phage N-6-adenine-methyltransferase
MSDLISSDLDNDMKNSWSTDPDVFNALDQEFKFSLDAAASDKNHLVPFYFTKEVDAISVDWYQELLQAPDTNGFGGMSVWVNPPYGRGCIKKFMNKAIEEKTKGVTTVMLVPATLDAQWLPLHSISEIRVVTGGRLSFYHPVTGKKVNGNTKGSMFVIFRPSSMPFFIRLIDRNELLSLGTTEGLAA